MRINLVILLSPSLCLRDSGPSGPYLRRRRIKGIKNRQELFIIDFQSIKSTATITIRGYHFNTNVAGVGEDLFGPTTIEIADERMPGSRAGGGGVWGHLLCGEGGIAHSSRQSMVLILEVSSRRGSFVRRFILPWHDPEAAEGEPSLFWLMFDTYLSFFSSWSRSISCFIEDRGWKMIVMVLPHLWIATNLSGFDLLIFYGKKRSRTELNYGGGEEIDY